MTTKANLIVTIALALTAGCAGPRVNVTPQQRTHAFELYIHGATTQQVAAELSLEPAAARAVIRGSLLELNRRYNRDR